MSKAVILIEGQIGNTYKADGTIDEKGYCLLDFLNAVADVPDGTDEIDVVINSGGGVVEEGKEIKTSISDLYKSTGGKVNTIAAETCASIASDMYLAVPVENRYIQSNCTNFLIHNPYFPQVSGDAAKLMEYAKIVEKYELDLEATYSKETGLSKETISNIMKKEEPIAPDMCVKMGFASKVIEVNEAASGNTVRPFAMFNQNNTSNMATVKEALAKVLAKITKTPPVLNSLGKTENRNVIAMVIKTETGDIETPFNDFLMVGDAVMIGGEVAKDGDYVISEGSVALSDGTTAGVGTIVTVVGGYVDKITPEVVAAEGNAELQAKLAAAEARANAAEAKVVALTAEKIAAEAVAAEATAVATKAVEELDELADMKSSFEAPQAQAFFREQKSRQQAVDFSREIQEKREALKSRKK